MTISRKEAGLLCRAIDMLSAHVQAQADSLACAIRNTITDERADNRERNKARMARRLRDVAALDRLRSHFEEQQK